MPFPTPPAIIADFEVSEGWALEGAEASFDASLKHHGLRSVRIAEPQGYNSLADVSRLFPSPLDLSGANGLLIWIRPADAATAAELEAGDPTAGLTIYLYGDLSLGPVPVEYYRGPVGGHRVAGHWSAVWLPWESFQVGTTPVDKSAVYAMQIGCQGPNPGGWTNAITFNLDELWAGVNMATSEVSIVNQALSEIGDSQFILDLGEDTENAKVATVHWEATQEDLLTAAPWGFCQNRAALALSATDPGTEWTYRYALPADCLRSRRVEGSGRNPGAGQEIPWVVEYDAVNAAPSLLTDVVDAVLVYTMRDIPVPFYPPWFAQALKWKLAAALAMGRTKDLKLQTALAQKAEFYKMQAFAQDLNQRGQDAAPESEFVRARDGGAASSPRRSW
jgi:hypothetical protein